MTFESIPDEIWKEIPGTDGRWAVSNHGRIKRLPGGRVKEERLLKLSSNARGYWSINFHLDGRNGNATRYMVHNLVAEVFIGPRPPDHECNHKDGDKKNNRDTNLEWVTHSENMKHADRLGLHPKPRLFGEKNPMYGKRGPSTGKFGEASTRHKLTWEKVREIRRRAASGEVQRALAKEFGVAESTLIYVVQGKTWKE